jgi:hypothetical protein
MNGYPDVTIRCVPFHSQKYLGLDDKLFGLLIYNSFNCISLHKLDYTAPNK